MQTPIHTHTQARQHKLQQLWHSESRPKVLTLAQDRNVAKFLSQGINKVFPKPKPARAPKFLAKEAGEQLVNAAKQDENAEERLWTPPQEKFVARKNGMRMAMEMEKSLQNENKAGGTYIDKYLHRVTGRQRSKIIIKRKYILKTSITATRSVRPLLFYYCYSLSTRFFFATAHCRVCRGRATSCRAATRGSGGMMSSCRHGWRREWAGSTNSRRVSTGRSMKSTSIPSRCRPCATTCSPQYVWARVLPQAWALLFELK